MQLSITEQFLKDYASLPHGLQKKCGDIINSIKKSDKQSLVTQIVPGWRLHKLNSSPFGSISIDMNFRILCKIEGSQVALHRAVKHDVAYSNNVISNDQQSAEYIVSEVQIRPEDLYDILLSFGFLPEKVKTLQGVLNEEELLEALAGLDSQLAEIILTVYETSGIKVPQSRYTLLPGTEGTFETTLRNSNLTWEIYLHPSQQVIAELPVEYRIAISGSAGTGKTVCAWHRAVSLVQNGKKIGFIAPNSYSLEVSKAKLEQLLIESKIPSYYLVPHSCDHLIQLSRQVDHIIIDEGQDFSYTWYQQIAKELTNNPVGLTVFFDLNQLNLGSVQNSYYENRVMEWQSAMRKIPQCKTTRFIINYRNSKEIAEYYKEVLSEILPKPIYSDVPAFTCGNVVQLKANSTDKIAFTISEIVRQLLGDQYCIDDFSVICVDRSISIAEITRNLTQIGIPAVSGRTACPNNLLIANPKEMRGYERKIVIAVVPAKDKLDKKIDRIINSYIAYSRARDRLFVINTTGGS